MNRHSYDVKSSSFFARSSYRANTPKTAKTIVSIVNEIKFRFSSAVLGLNIVSLLTLIIKLRILHKLCRNTIVMYVNTRLIAMRHTNLPVIRLARNQTDVIATKVKETNLLLFWALVFCRWYSKACWSPSWSKLLMARGIMRLAEKYCSVNTQSWISRKRSPSVAAAFSQ